MDFEGTDIKQINVFKYDLKSVSIALDEASTCANARHELFTTAVGDTMRWQLL